MTHGPWHGRSRRLVIVSVVMLSVLAAAAYVPNEFLLLMADHLWEPALLDPILADRAAPDADGAVLAVDRDVEGVYDLEDATLVRTDDAGRIVDIGKEITKFDCVDTGVFRCTDGLLEALAAERATRGDCSLSDGIRRLAQAGRMRTVSIEDAWWQDVDTPGALHHAERLLAAAEATPVAT